MPVQYFIIAGPQAAGKSTITSQICSNDSNVTSLEESRRVVIHNAKKKGAIFMSDLDEVEVIHHDMLRMFTILGQNRTDRLYFDETNVFTIAHARAHGIDLLEGYFRQYVDLLRRFQAAVLFIDVPPSVSWERRKQRYSQRLWDYSDEEKAQTMFRYRTYLDRLYPELCEIYQRLDFPKAKIDGTSSIEETAAGALEAIRELRRGGAA